jgi:hypothetical protein
MNDNLKFNDFKKKIYNLLYLCKKIKQNDSNDYLVKNPSPILDAEGFIKMNYTTRINFKQFLLNSNTEITNSKDFKDNEDFFFNYEKFITYLINKKIIKKVN